MIRHWFTQADAPLASTFVKRFDPRHFTVDFPRGAIASAILGDASDSLLVTAEFLRHSDLVGLIYASDDSRSHPNGRREHSRDYRRCQLSFRWKSSGLPGLDAVNGPTLTIEGRDSSGQPRTWYVRLWNYASGSSDDALIQLDFDDLLGGFNLATDADPVEASDIDRLFFSLVPVGFAAEDSSFLGSGRDARLEISDLRCEGSGSVLTVNDAMVPEHALRMCTAYDDLYHLVPEQIIESIERLGYRKLINHYVGMSHHQGVDEQGLIDQARPINAAAAAWHGAFANAAQRAGFEVIFSLSFEIIDPICPEDWKQRSADGAPAHTGYDPPSSLVSPACEEAVDYLARTAVAFGRILQDAGLRTRIQLGEPWWWVTSDNRLCLYDDAAKAAFGGDPVIIDDVRGYKTPEELALLDKAGAFLAASTDTIATAVRQSAMDAELLLLVYLPSVLARDRPELSRANLPSDWASPAFDVLQLEDYEWLTKGWTLQSGQARAFAGTKLNYPPERQHYLIGFADSASARSDWNRIAAAARGALATNVGEVLVWAMPQVLRDQVTMFDDGVTAMDDVDDVLFPVAISAGASVSPGFSTTVLTSASGHEFRNSNWSQARLRFDAGPGVRGDDELKALITFFRARRGSARAFRFRDPYDHSSNNMTEAPTMLDEGLGPGDGLTTTFELLKTYGDGERRRITRPTANSIQVAVDGVAQASGWSPGSLGTICFDEPPASGAIITAGFEFDVPVRFASDQLAVNRTTFLAGEVPSVPLVEVRETSL